MAHSQLGNYPRYNYAILADTRNCTNRKNHNSWTSVCGIDGSRRTTDACRRCPHYRPTFKERLKLAWNFLLWKNVRRIR